MAGKILYAHSANSKGKWHGLKDHLEAVAKQARKFALKTEIRNLEKPVFMSGLGHDMGKVQERFLWRLYNAPVRVDHSSPGMMLACKSGRLDVGFVIAGHHGGLPDLNGEGGRGMRERVKKI